MFFAIYGVERISATHRIHPRVYSELGSLATLLISMYVTCVCDDLGISRLVEEYMFLNLKDESAGYID